MNGSEAYLSISMYDNCDSEILVYVSALYI